MSKNEFQSIVSQALDNPDNLTDWEYDFISDLADLESDEFYSLTDRQKEILLEISEKL